MHATKPEKLVLVVEDSVVTSVAVGRVIEHALKDCRIVRAQSCFEAKLLLSVYEFHLFILDIHLPDGCGLDLLAEIVAKDPAAATIVLTADPAPENRDRSTAFGVQHFITKPFRSETLSEAVRQSLSGKEAQQRDPLFAAALKRLSVLDVVQLKCLNRASTRLEVSSTRESLPVGFIDLEEGEIVHAEVRDDSFDVFCEGREAISEILSWSEGTIEELDRESSVNHTIHEPWQSLLLNTAQCADEQEQPEVALQN
jgi:DNA-binding NarL/FixJ family response regulator